MTATDSDSDIFHPSLRLLGVRLRRGNEPNLQQGASRWPASAMRHPPDNCERSLRPCDQLPERNKDFSVTMRFSHQESVPVEGCDRRRWPGLQRVVRDFQCGPSEQAPAKRHSALGRLTALTCRDASLARPWTANPGEKTSLDEVSLRATHDTWKSSMTAW